MSDPTYRIDVYRATDDLWDSYPWKARTYRLSDDALVAAGVGKTSLEAVDMACDMIRRITAAPEPFSVYVDDDGQPVEAHSVKA